jgi:hypothetical protein
MRTPHVMGWIGLALVAAGVVAIALKIALNPAWLSILVVSAVAPVGLFLVLMDRELWPHGLRKHY